MSDDVCDYCGYCGEPIQFYGCPTHGIDCCQEDTE